MPAMRPHPPLRWTIRRLRDDDIDAVLRLAMHNQSHGRPTRLLLNRALTDASTRVLVARSGVSLAGYAVMRLLPRQRLGYLNALAVDRLHRRCGLARRLLQALLIECRVLGLTRITLDVADTNTPALRLYESLGFEVLGRRPQAYADGTEAVQMTLDL